MYEEERPTRSFRSYEPPDITWSTRISNWIESKLNNIWDVILAALIPIIQLIAFLLLIVVLSVIINIYLRRVMVPRALLHERVYFDYIAERPTATIKLHSAMQQWNYMKGDMEDASPRRRFLKADSRYDIHAVFTIAKSARNYDIGISPLTLKVVDASGDTVAKSVRALVIPYQHPMSLLLESVTYFPWRATRTWTMAETVDVWVNVMPDYREPAYAMPPTESLEIALAAPVMDLSHAYVTVMPKLYGIVYFMYYYPWVSFAAGCALVSGVQVLVYLVIAVVVFGLRYAFQNMSSEDPLEMQYANSRRRKAAAAHAASSADSDLHGDGLDRSRAPLYSSIALHADDAARAAAVNRGMREFVNTHLPGAVVEEIIEEDDNLIDAINADLLSSQHRHRLYDADTTSSAAVPTTTQASGGPPSMSRVGGLSVSSVGAGRPDPTDWDYGRARRNTPVSNTSGPTTPRSTTVPPAATTPAPAGTTPGELSTGRTRQHSVSFVPSPRPITPANSPSATAGSGAATPASTASRGRASSTGSSHASTASTADSQDQEGEGEDFEQVFQNDFFNKFFPFLRRKGSAGDRDKKHQ